MTMAARRNVAIVPPPLLVWREQTAIEQLEKQRQRLMSRIAALPRYSHRRIELECRLKELTARELELQNAIRRNA